MLTYKKGIIKSMELDQLKAFVIVADEKNITKASEKLFITQPALSTKLKLLEDELQVELFTRTSKGMDLTETGVILKTEAQKIIESAEQFKNTALNLKNEKSGIIRLGINTNIKLLKINKLFSMSNLYSPNIEIQLTQSVSPDILKKVKNKEIDIGFIFGKFKTQNILIKKLADIELCIFGPINWENELNSLKSVEELSKYPWIVPPEGCPFSIPLNYFFSQNNIVPSKKIVADSDEMINNLVRLEQGLSVMLKDETKEIIDNKELFILKDYTFNIDLSIAYLASKIKNPIIKVIFNYILEIWENKNK